MAYIYYASQALSNAKPEQFSGTMSGPWEKWQKHVGIKDTPYNINFKVKDLEEAIASDDVPNDIFKNLTVSRVSDER